MPELKNCSTHADTLERAANNANEAITAWIEAAQKADVEIPEPISKRKFSGKFITRIDPDIHRKLFLEAKKKEKSLNSLVKEILT